MLFYEEYFCSTPLMADVAMELALVEYKRAVYAAIYYLDRPPGVKNL